MRVGEQDFLHYLKTEGMDLTGKYGIPTVKGIKLKNLDSADLLGFNYCTSTKSIETMSDRFVHFFLPDTYIERAWDNLDYYATLLSMYKGVIQPDFSQYTDMPQAMRIWQHYRRMWLAQYYQNQGLRVIPAPCWSDEDSFEYCFDGMPKGSCLCISSVGCIQNVKAATLFKAGFKETLKQLEPSQIILYGSINDDIRDMMHGIPYKHIESEQKQRISHFLENKTLLLQKKGVE